MTDSNSIFITGFMGAGKTTIARYLSSLMGMAWFDLDAVIQKSVVEFFFLCLVVWLLSGAIASPRKSAVWWIGVAMGCER